MSALKELLLGIKKSDDYNAAYEKLAQTKFFVLVEQNERDEDDNYDFVVFGNDDFPDPMVIVAEDLSLLKMDYNAVQIFGYELIQQLHEDLAIMVSLGEKDGGFVIPKDDLEWIRETMTEVPQDGQQESDPSPFQSAIEEAKKSGSYDDVWPTFLNTTFFVLISSEENESDVDDYEFMLFQNPKSSKASLLVSEDLELLNDHDCDAVQTTGGQLIGLLSEPHGIAVVMDDEVFSVPEETVRKIFESMDLNEADA